MSIPPQQIGIAVVEHAGCYLVGTRGPDGPLAGYSEFPGGKCLPGESADVCAVRECLEETRLAVTVDRLLLRREHSYSHAAVDLSFYLCRPVRTPAADEDHNGFRWVPAIELSRLNLPEANAPVVALLGAE